LPAAFDRERVRADPLGELTRAYFGTIPDVFRRPNDELYRWLGQELAARQVRGILLHRYVWCDIWHAELARLKQWSPVPVLEIDECDDDASLGRTAGRIEAFLEMLT
jgi:benzoyl-CoA reductase/2-hydroxyglutaryl-CoA dehydratase subunit BcrC/BadD/HgdB